MTLLSAHRVEHGLALLHIIQSDKYLLSREYLSHVPPRFLLLHVRSPTTGFREPA